MSLADMLYGSAQQAETSGGQAIASGVQEGVKNYQAGAQLALQQQDLTMRQQQMAMQMQQLQSAKSEKLMTMMENGFKLTPAQQNVFFGQDGVFRQARDNMGLTQSFPDTALKFATSDTDAQARGAGIIAQYRDDVAAGKNPSAVDSLSKLANPLIVGTSSPYYADLNKNMQDAVKDTQTQAAALRDAKARGQQSTSPDVQLANFGKTVANPSTRSDMGISKQMVAAADSIKQLTDAKLPANATKEQAVAAYNSLTPQQNTEVIRSLDRMLSRSNPTVHGQENLEPGTLADLVAKYGQKVGNTPIGSNMGEFIYNMMGTVNRERDMNASKFKAAANVLKETNVNAKATYGDKMDALIDSAVAPPKIGGADTVQFNGHAWPRTQLQEAIKNSKDKNLIDAATKALGGG